MRVDKCGNVATWVGMPDEPCLSAWPSHTMQAIGKGLADNWDNPKGLAIP